MATDWDCWHETHEDVTVEGVLAIMRQNVGHARAVIRAAIPRLTPSRACACKEALRYAIMTEPSRIPAAARDRLGLLIDKYLPA
jgi:5'-methylthioadenosine phosphorylase